MPAPTISDLPTLPTFPSGPGLPDQPGVFIPQFLAFLSALNTWADQANALAAYLEGLGGSSGSSSSSSGSLRWNVVASAADQYSLVSSDVGKHVRFTNGNGVSIIVPVDASHGFLAGERIRFTQDGAGEVVISPSTGVTVNSIQGLVSLGQGAVFELEYVGPLEWDALGELTQYLIALSGDMTDGDDLILLSGDMSDGEDFELTSGV